MKHIGVLVENIAVDYAQEIINGIFDFYKEKDDQVVIFPTRQLKLYDGEFDYQYWWGKKLAETDYFDAIIVITGSYLSYMTLDDLHEQLNGIDENKLVSVAIPIPNSKIKYTYSKCESTYNTIVSHLIKEHGCKKIAFNSALQCKSVEAEDRFNAYKKALENNNLVFDPDLVIPGNFTHTQSYENFLEKYPTKESVNFDALICSNDMEAYGCIDAMKTLEIRIPEDVKVFGYDDIEKSRQVQPTLSTVNQQLSKQGREAAQIAFDIAHNPKKKIPQETEIKLEPIYRQSCGCKDINNSSITEYQENLSMKDVLVPLIFQSRINFFLDRMNDTVDLDAIYKRIDVMFALSDFTSASICLFEEEVLQGNKEPFTLPNRIQLSGVAERGISYGHSCSYTFNPHNMLMPEDVLTSNKGIYLFQPIYNGARIFGYLCSRAVNTSFYLQHILLKIFAHSIGLAYEYSRSLEKNLALSAQNVMLQIKNSNLDKTSRTDELTNIMNRRGVLEMGQKLIDLSIEMNQSGVVFFGDMNNLKKINDTYGHEMGDIAIQTQAEVFKGVFRSNDIVGRLSGDEFVAIVPGLSLAQVDSIRNKFTKKAQEFAKEKNLPFDFSISLGAVEFNSENFELQKLIKEADSKQYEEKRLYHLSRDDK